MPQSSVDPVVLAAMIVIRLQTVVSREIAPAEAAVLTIGRIEAGTKSNVIGERAVLELNLRTYNDPTRARMLAAIRRIVTAECQASGSPKEPEFELVDHFPATDNDPTVTARVRAAFDDFFGDRACELAPQTASEDFSDIPRALDAPTAIGASAESTPTPIVTPTRRAASPRTYPSTIPRGSPRHPAHTRHRHPGVDGRGAGLAGAI